jgi:CelD/BcsL family acetyltransferase involved in cellulose biosynthesis
MQRQGGIDIDVITDLTAAQARWEALERDGAATPFQSFAWISTLARTVGRAFFAEIFVLIVREVATGRDLMLLPLVRRPLGPIRMIELPDFGVSDYSAPIVAPEIAAAPARFVALWKLALAAIPSADLIRINKMPEQVNQHRNPFLRLSGLWPKETQSWSVTLPECWSDYEANMLSGKFRRNIRRSLKNLKAIGALEYVVAREPVTADKIFAALCAHREARFKRLGRANILDRAEYREFYRQILHGGLASGLSSLSALVVDSKIVATIFGLYWRGTYFALIPTMTEAALHGHSVGKIINWLQVREVHARGCRHFDFTIGNESYKRDYGATPTKLYEAAWPLKLRGAPVAWSLRFRTGVRRWREPAIAGVPQ